MKEKNRDIFERAMNNLPHRKAAPGAWTGIAAGLDSLDASRFMGENKGRLPVHKAPAGTWKGIEQGLQASLWSGAAGLMIKIGSVAVMTATVVTAVILLSPGDEDSAPAGNPAVTIQQLQAPADQETGERVADSGDDPGVSDRHQEGKTRERQVLDTSARTDVPASQGNVFQQDIANQEDVRDLGPLPGSRSARTQEGLAVIYPLAFPGFAASAPEMTQVLMRQTPGNRSAGDDYYREKQGFDISLGLHSAWMKYHQVDLEGMNLPEAVPSFGLDVLFEMERFYLKTGLSYASWEESATYRFSFNRNELVYSYHYVDSAWFDPSTSQVSYYTTEQEVFDSVFYTRPDEIVNRYRVLQVPLEIGYKLVESRRWMIGVHAGLGADINIGTQTFTPEFSDDQASLVGVEDHMVYRPALNWRLAAGAGIRYRFARRLSLYLEPAYHTYLNTVYPGASNSNVSYFQLKFSILYKF